MNRRQRRANKAKILGRVFIDYGLDNVGRVYWRKRGRPTMHGPFASQAEAERDAIDKTFGPQCEIKQGGTWGPTWEKMQKGTPRNAAERTKDMQSVSARIQHELPAEMVATFIELANQNEERMDGTVAPVREIIGGSDIVIGIWPDATRSDGVDYSLIKGASILREGVAHLPTITAIWCVEAAQAAACREVFCPLDDQLQ
jgi:hypothetical protein